MSFDPKKLSPETLKSLVKDQRRALATIAGQDLPRHQAQEVVARMFGYATWHEAVARAKAAAKSTPTAKPEQTESTALGQRWLEQEDPLSVIPLISASLRQGNARQIGAQLAEFQEGMRHLEKSWSQKKPSLGRSFIYVEFFKDRWEVAFRDWIEAACEDQSGVAMTMLLPLYRGCLDEVILLAIDHLNPAALAAIRLARPNKFGGWEGEKWLVHAVTVMQKIGGETRPVDLEKRWPLVVGTMETPTPPKDHAQNVALKALLYQVDAPLDLPLALRLVEVGANLDRVVTSLRNFSPQTQEVKLATLRGNQVIEAWNHRKNKMGSSARLPRPHRLR